ncbi:MAG: DUF6544 family protein [candidate division KSB1 bacterium]|nr:DUF6544 family protein [candidate division KSB1 bacterium]
MISSCNSLKKLYLSEIGETINDTPIKKGGIYTENDFFTLPAQIQNYFKNCGYIGKEKIENIKIDYSNSFIKMSPEKKWLKIKYYQVNFTHNPTRLAYISSKIIGIFSFEGRDKYQAGKGNMLIRLLKLFTVADAKGKEMDKSALATLLSEVLFMPSFATREQIKWKSIDENSVEAKYRDNDNVVSGIFYFNGNHEFIRFTTDDRFYSLKDGSYKKTKWSVELSNYKDFKGIKFPENVKAIWHMDDKDYEYFRTQIKDVQYNINKQSTNAQHLYNKFKFTPYP